MRTAARLALTALSIAITCISPHSATCQEESTSIAQQLQDFLSEDNATGESLIKQPFAAKPILSGDLVNIQTQLLDFRRDSVLETRAQEHKSRVVKLDDIEMRYAMRKFGDAPATGHCLVISMHGGGNAPKRVNDQQWKNQVRLYDLEEGIYIAPRAPTDTWNLWHEEHIDGLFTRLIETLILTENVDPNRVYITGYSAGGDGVYQLAPRMADQLAAAAMMAGHPNETKPLGLRNLPFTLHVGEKDGGYQRNEHAVRWKAELKELRQQDPKGYTHWAKLHSGKGHWMDRDDAEGVNWMLEHTRNILPKRIVWLQDDIRHGRFYWLAEAASESSSPQRAKTIAVRSGNTFDIETSDEEAITILLRDDMIDFNEPVVVKYQGKIVHSGKAIRTIDTLWSTIKDRGDPTAVFPGSVTVRLDESE